ncbi:S-adenosyl-L-methionine-dependent methyltransferase [Penicillium angulare]|uniref:S-adenosyl-L-methionine-dependent methyltransferase n=1 Tax=Penicillium angulare TaxID=116970 RepID=UPI0025407567|nr:S-adenosyl-L-methionine-dependent methyltransferase [Penicillium angulare]KAJ5280990.1 S-adenosyl-L-methionine-dependent methyltransferase [Penicillium angulare]
MEYLIRLAQWHQSFRVPELQAVATLVGVDLEIIFYDDHSPYCIVKLPDEAAARALIARSILAKDIFELWGHGENYDEVHADIKTRSAPLWPKYQKVSFAFDMDTFCGKRSASSRLEIFKSFHYIPFGGSVKLKNPDEQFLVMERYLAQTEATLQEIAENPNPLKIYLGRYIASSDRGAIIKYDLKKRSYISTTSMDAELSLVTANMTLAAPGKLFYDPFVGTGSFLVAAAHFGALTMGSDIDPRSFRGKDEERKSKNDIALLRNYQQYNTVSKYVDSFTSDLTNTPLRDCKFLDGIVCDPPYGVREGLRVLGTRDGKPLDPVVIDGVLNYYRPGYIPPKRPYGFEAMQKDILAFAARALVTNGRIAMWMPTAIDEVGLPVPMDQHLEVVSVSTQTFGNWARRLITYRRLPEGEFSDMSQARSKEDARGVSASEVNEFRRKYFNKFQDEQ